MATTFEQATAKASAPKRAKSADRHWRSVVKAISWRAVGTVDTMIISYFITGKIKWALSIGFVELFTKIFLFYVHERVWHRIPYGKASEKPE